MQKMVSLIDINDYWLVAEMIFFINVGIFGNFNMVWCTIRKKELRTKPGKDTPFFEKNRLFLVFQAFSSL